MDEYILRYVMLWAVLILGYMSFFFSPFNRDKTLTRRIVRSLLVVNLSVFSMNITRLLNYSEEEEDRFAVNLQKKRANTSEDGGENALPFPVDLVFEIFSRLSVKCIARCRCVSKIWSSILCRREFTDLFMSKSYARPQLLFVYENVMELLVFSSPQPRNPDENSPPIIANNQMSFSFDGDCRISGVANGLVCVMKEKLLSNGRKEMIPVICNPSTGEFFSLKKVKTRKSELSSLFGYDPIDKGFKILSITCGYSSGDEEHQVLTLGTSNLRMFYNWRMVKDCIPSGHLFLEKGLCINGVMYYRTCDNICCFDIRSEKFSYIEVNETLRFSALINYSGNLGLIWFRSTSLKLWVLEDVERQEWSKRIIVLPPMWKCVIGNSILGVVGVTGTNEIVLRTYRSHPLCLFYLNIDKNTIIRVEVQGLGMYKHGRIHIFMNHVEDVKLI